MPFGLQPIHLVAVAIVALLIFGPQRLPEIGRGVGKAITEFRRGAKEMGSSFTEELNQPIDSPAQTAAQPPASVASEQPAGSNFCIHCGKANPAGAVFCNQCGSKIAE